MRILLIILFTLSLFTSCVSIETYNQDIDSLKKEKNFLQEENLKLKVDLEITKGNLVEMGKQLRSLEQRLAKEIQD
jgi:hypothetical protein